MPFRPTRRSLLKLAGLSGATALAPLGIGAPAFARSGAARPGPERPRNIIFLVSDGMSAGVLPMADHFSRVAREPAANGTARGTHWQRMMQLPGVAQGLTETYALNAVVTDSAAAASAWGSGSRVNNGALNRLPDGTELVPLAQLARQSGRRVGLVSTCTITHATPAGFAVVEERRGNEEAIAAQYLDRVDVLLGGGRRFFDPAHRGDKRDLLADFAAAGYAAWQRRSELFVGTAPQRVLGLFASSHLPYALDQRHDAALTADVPTLAEMTRAALQVLDQGPKGFFLMVEGGRVDHAAHANDAAALLWDQLAFDDALGEALAFAENRPEADTLVIVTTDHGNSNPGLSAGSQQFERLAAMTASYSGMLRQIQQTGGDATGAAVLAVLTEHTKLPITAEHAEVVAALLRKEPTAELSRFHANPVGALGQILGNHTGIGWTSVSHTSDHANLNALGPGAERFQGFHRNTEAFRILTDLWAIDHRNPEGTPAQSWREARQTPRPSAPASGDFADATVQEAHIALA